MKLILTETQYKILEGIINEATLMPMSTDMVKGIYVQVVYLVKDNEKDYTVKAKVEITDVYGDGRYVSGVSKGGNFIFDISRALDKNSNTFTSRKDGEYEEGYSDGDGNSMPGQIVGGSQKVIPDVLEVNIIDSSSNVVEKLRTSLGDEVIGSDDEDKVSPEDKKAKQKESDRREQEVYDEIMNDPLLKKAFYHQPKIFGGLLNYGKAKGIGPAMALINKYVSGSSLDSKDKSKFKIGKMVKYVVVDTSVNITYNKQKFLLPLKSTFKARYNSQGELAGAVLMDGGNKYKYQIEDLKSVGDDTYEGTINVEFKGEHSGTDDIKEDITLKIIKYETN